MLEKTPERRGGIIAHGEVRFMSLEHLNLIGREISAPVLDLPLDLPLPVIADLNAGHQVTIGTMSSSSTSILRRSTCRQR
ncbi:hypothetical protein ACFSLT_08020 [Novosphingobium resinovorum]